MAISSRERAVLKWTGISLGALVLVFLVAAIVLDWNANAFRGPIARIASRHAGRPIHIDGPLELRLLSLEPRAIADSVRIGNPGWSRSRDMAHIGRLEISLALPALFKAQIVVPRVNVH